jgi:hypothetical protein
MFRRHTEAAKPVSNLYNDLSAERTIFQTDLKIRKSLEFIFIQTRICYNLCFIIITWPITVATRSKAWIVFARLNAEILGSNLTPVMDVCIVCLYSVFVLFCV